MYYTRIISTDESTRLAEVLNYEVNQGTGSVFDHAITTAGQIILIFKIEDRKNESAESISLKRSKKHP